MPRLPPLPDLSWTAEGAPRAGGFDDVYFSRAGGLAESEAVFLAGCGLPDAWRGRERFAICELGFGTGLNVLAAWRAWKRVRTPHAILHISSLEAYPLARPDAEKALSNFPEVAPLAAKLLGQWPVRTYAPQRFWFPDDGFALTLHVGDVAAILSRLEARFDAWFLDGFAPSRNPDMWSAEVFAQVARLSAPKARLATFTVAGGVRRALADVGFAVEKKQGFGAKRERLEAQFLGPVSPMSGGRPYPFVATAPKRVAVLGAGIAGASCAQALVRRGVETLVIEDARSAATGASGNPAGLVMPRLDRGPLSELFLAAFLDAVKTYELLGVFDPCGVEERAQQRAQAALADMIEDPPLPGDWFEALGGVKVLHRRAGLVRPGAAVAAMLRDASLMCETSVEVLEGTGDGWILRANGGRAIMKADAVVLACGAALARFEPASFLPIELSRGQIEWGRGAQPEHAIAQGSYVAPFDGGLLFGATFDAIESGIEAKTDAESRRRNLAALETIAPELAASVDVGALQSRASVRATTSDRAPIAGSAPDAAAWLATFAEIKHGRTPEIAPPAHSGVYIFGGLGARGLTLAPLLGERIASEMFAEPHVLSRPVLDAIHPARFLYRRLRRGTA